METQGLRPSSRGRGTCHGKARVYSSRSARDESDTANVNPLNFIRVTWAKVLRRLGRIAYWGRRTLFLLPKRRGSSKAKFGVYVAHFDSSRIYETHLECFQNKTVQPFNYYVMKNCTNESESDAFDKAVEKFGFPIVFEPWPRMDPLPHGRSLQRLIDMTTDDIIVLCDVDAFPIERGWDEFVLKELETKDVVAVVAHFPVRSELPVFLHPCFMAFKRRFVVENKLDMIPIEGRDPAFRVTEHLMKTGRLDEQYVTALFPTSHEVAIPHPGNDTTFFGRTGLLHGFGTTYSNMIFHYWFARHIRTLSPIYNDEGTLVVTSAQMENVIRKINSMYGPAADGPHQKSQC